MKTELNNKDARARRILLTGKCDPEGLSRLLKPIEGYRRLKLTIIFSLAMVALFRAGAPVAATADAATVLIPLQTCGIAQAANRNVILTPIQAQGADEIPVMDRIQTNTDQNGNASLSLLPGVYQCDVRPAWGQVGVTQFYFYVDPSNATQNAFANLLTATNNTYPPNQFAWSAQASDARYAPIGVVANAANAVTNTQPQVNFGVFALGGSGPFTRGIMAQPNDNAQIVIDQASGERFYDSAGNRQLVITPGGVDGNFISPETNFDSRGWTNTSSSGVTANAFNGPLHGNASTSGTSTNAQSILGIPGNQIISTSPSKFTPSALPGLYALWEADQFLGYTNGQTIPANWIDMISGLVMTNYAQINAVPTYAANAINENPGIYFAGIAAGSKVIYACTNFTILSMLTNCTIFLEERDMIDDGFDAPVVMCVSSNTASNPGFFITPFVYQGAPNQDAGGSLRVSVTNSAYGLVLTMGHYSPDFIVIRFGLYSATQIQEKVWLNGRTTFDTSLTSGGVGGGNNPIVGGDGIWGNLYLGASPNSGTAGFQGYIGCVGWYTNALTDDQIASLNGMLAYKYHKRNRTIVLDGASQSIGSGSIIYSNMPELLHQYLPGWDIDTVANGGCGSGTELTNAYSWINTRRNEAGPSIAILGSDVGWNDMHWLSLGVTATETNIINYVALLHTNGWMVGVVTPISAYIWETNTTLTRSNLLNWETNTTAGGADFLIRADIDPLVGTNGSYSNAPIYSAGDFLHPGMLGCASMITNEYIPTILAQPTVGGNMITLTSTNIPPLFAGQQTTWGNHIYYASNAAPNLSWMIIR